MGCTESKEPIKDTSSADTEVVHQTTSDLQEINKAVQKLQAQQSKCHEVETKEAESMIRDHQLERAKMLLTQRKARMTYLHQIGAYLNNVNCQIGNVETKTKENNFVGNVQQTTDILSNINQLMTVKDIEALENNDPIAIDKLLAANKFCQENLTREDKKMVDHEYQIMQRDIDYQMKQEAEEMAIQLKNAPVQITHITVCNA